MIRLIVCGLLILRASLLGCIIVFACSAEQSALGAGGAFAAFPGSWDGTGKIRIGDKTERIRCKATYSTRGSNASDIVLALICASDSYKFDLSGEFQADENNKIRGNWSERSRGVNGIASGSTRGDRFQIHVESAPFSGNVTIVTHGGSQSVNIDTIGTEDKISATIALHRSSR
jgi:hypothetical protein